MLQKRSWTGSRGFSMSELLIVVLVFVPLFFWLRSSGRLKRQPETRKAGQPLEVIKKAIALYDARESRPLTGTNLQVLVGRYMQLLPIDPFGKPYLFDGSAGILACYGSDGLPGGRQGPARDLVVYTKPPLSLARVQYTGPWGRIRTAARSPQDSKRWAGGSKMIVTLNKPTVVSAHQQAVHEIVLLTHLGAPATKGFGAGGSVPLDSPRFGGGDQPGFQDATMAPVRDPLHRPEHGILVAFAAVDGVAGSQMITPTMALDFAWGEPTSDFPYAYGDLVPSVGARSLAESYVADGASPLDPGVYGPEAQALYAREPQPCEPFRGERRGVRIEAY